MLVLKFIDKLRKCGNTDDSEMKYLSKAEQLWLEDVQGTLSSDNNFPQLRKQLDLFRDEKGIWRCGSRLGSTELPYATKHPIFISRDYFSLLIVKQAHCRVFHNGGKETLTEVRSKYWIVRVDRLLRRLFRNVLFFRGMKDQPTRLLLLRHYPLFRLTNIIHSRTQE